MKITFSKYHGAGNDFIMIDNSNSCLNPKMFSSVVISNLCHRRFGIGADGLIMVNPSDQTDFEMKFYNADGLPGSMCGNGGRCIAAFAYEKKLIGRKTIFSAFDGLHQAEVISETSGLQLIKLQMQDVAEIRKEHNDFIINTGSPHFIRFTKDVEGMDVFQEGRKIRYSERFKSEGINVNFAEFKNDFIFSRTYERGVEDETLSCGTGVTAVAIAAHEMKMLKENSCNIKTIGGDLKVYFSCHDDQYTDLWLEGPAVKVFDGEVDITPLQKSVQ